MKINIYGSTGIIGTKTLSIIDKYFPKIKINLLCANNNVYKLIHQSFLFSPKYVYINNHKKYKILKKNINPKSQILNFNELKYYLKNSSSDYSILAISGYKALKYFDSILNNTSSLGLVNKEIVVSAGHLFKNLSKKNKVKIYPLDSEHFSIFKNFNKKEYNLVDINKVILTASGGPFLGKSYKSLKDTSFKKASKHPKWKMGYKNSIDSATLTNKCLELVEAHYLFNIPYEKLKIVIHPESIVHSIIEHKNYFYTFNAFKPDMLIPIFHFLNQKFNNNINIKNLSITNNRNFNFYNVKKNEFPIYNLFSKIDKKNPCNLIKFNVGNEYAVNLFKNNIIRYTDIYKIVNKISSLNLKYKLNNIKDILNYHEILEKKIDEKFSSYF